MMLYHTAAYVLDEILKKKGTPKSLIMGNKNIKKNKKQIYALVCETLKYKSILEKLLQAVNLLGNTTSTQRLMSSLLLLVTYDATIGKGIFGRGKVQDLIRNNLQHLKSALAELKANLKITNNKDLLPPEYAIIESFPRYVRVNTLKITVCDVVSHLLQDKMFDEFLHFENSNISWMEFVHSIVVSNGRRFTSDIHVDNLLIFPPGTNFHEHVLYRNGSLILQDKASCIPAQVLMPEPGSIVIDACAAPGNKTTQLAALMDNKGVIYAFDLNHKRLATLRNNVNTRSAAPCVKPIHKDFLTVSPSESEIYFSVEYILVDPSCSGSGMLDRFSNATDDSYSTSKQRISNLAKFQLSLLKHALSFPYVKRVVYSTCSMNSTENEDVISQALQEYSNTYKLVHIMPEWKNRGISGGKVDRYVIRCNPKSDLTNGFFVACFERTCLITIERKHIVENEEIDIQKRTILHTLTDNMKQTDSTKSVLFNKVSDVNNRNLGSVKQRKKRRGRSLKPITCK